MKEIFKSEDFSEVLSVVTKDKNWYADYISKVANIKVNDLISSWPIVYGHETSDAWHYCKTNEKESWLNSATHTARIAFIEEIKEESKVKVEISVSYPDGKGWTRQATDDEIKFIQSNGAFPK